MSGRRQPCGGQRQCIVPDDQPTLRGHVGAGGPKVGHLPVADLGGFHQIIQGQLPADPAALVVDHDLQQPSGDRFRCLLTRPFPGDPTTFDAAMFGKFSYALSLMVSNVTSQQQDGKREDAHARVMMPRVRWC